MTETIEIDARTLAQALHMDDTAQLSEVLTKWASESMPIFDFGRRFAPPDLDYFDERVALARRYLEDAHAAIAAYNEDFPLEPEGDE